MTASLRPTKLIGLTALAVVALAAIHGWLVAPWESYGRFGVPLSEPLGTWAIAPCALGALALLIGDVKFTAQRPSVVDARYAPLVAVVLTFAVVALLAAIRPPIADPPLNWMERLLGPATATGAGLALCALFWQGMVQPGLPDTLGPFARSLITASLAASIWVPFALFAGPVGGQWAVIIDLFVLSCVAALLYELGMTSLVIMVLVGFAGAATAVIHGHLFL